MSTSNKSPKILSVNDTKILDCQFCSNNVSVKIDRANDLISSITDVDIILIEDKQLAKDLMKPRNFYLIRKDGERVFYLKGEYKFFKNEDAFIRAAVRTVKRGH